jgi:hypothetical protein
VAATARDQEDFERLHRIGGAQGRRSEREDEGEEPESFHGTDTIESQPLRPECCQ